MLVLGRKEQEEIVVNAPPGEGARIVIRVAELRHEPGHSIKVRLGVTAPKHVRIVRGEIEQRQRADVRDKVADGKDSD